MDNLNPLDYSCLRQLMERNDAQGNRIPFSITFVAQDGAVIDVQQPVMECIKVEPRYRRHLIKSTVSNEIRWVRDCLILRVNDSRIVVR